MKSLTHYGVEVIYQASITNFIDTLKEKGIQYKELPIVDYQILSYIYQGKRKFALINPISVLEEYREDIYITEEIPIDCNWEKLVEDIKNQCHGEKPIEIPTRASLIIQKACRIANKELNKKYEYVNYNVFENLSPCWDEEEEIECVMSVLLHMGYNKKDIASMDTHDINQEFIKKLIKYSEKQV